MKNKNPFGSGSNLPFNAPDFNRIGDEHYLPVFGEGIKQQAEEIHTITENEEQATFENTILAMEKSGGLLGRVKRIFFNMASSHTNETLMNIQSEMAPRLAAHTDNIFLNRKLYSRITKINEDSGGQNLSKASRKLLTDTRRDFVRAGAELTKSRQKRMREINKRISSLISEFQNSLLKIMKERSVVVDDAGLLEGLDPGRISAAGEAASQQGMEGKYLLAITNTTRQPVLANLKNRDMRKKVWHASAFRGIGEDEGIDTRPLLLEMVKLRAEKAGLLGYRDFASYAIETETAKAPEDALQMLSDLIPPVIRNVDSEASQICKMMKGDGIKDDLQPWDWEYYAEKVRKQKYDIDEDDLRPYFELNRVLKEGVFYTMECLFGITFKERDDLPVYHRDVRVFDVIDADGSPIGLFYGDYFARENKRGGAWMSSFENQSRLKNQKPVIVNVLNIPRPAEGEPALVPFDHVTTLFHEMGHAVHGLLSDVEYPSQSGTSVPRDFVEFPSTFEEDWALHPEIISRYAVHHQTGEPLPEEMLDRLIASRQFNQGYDTCEYLAAAVIDLEWHSLAQGNVPDAQEDVEKFEAEILSKYGFHHHMVSPRYKSPFFAHIFAGGYAAHYYAYIWSEVLAADTFAFFMENGGLARKNGSRYRKYILSKGGSVEAMELYHVYRGKAPDASHLLKRRGLNRS